MLENGKMLQKVYKHKVFQTFQRGALSTPICEICGMEAVAVNTCSECGAKFCDECGDIKNKLCYDCLGWDTEGEEESWDKDDFEDWDEEDPN